MKVCAVVLATLLLVEFSGCSNPNRENLPAASAPSTPSAAKPADERAALQFLSDLNKAQSDFHHRTRRYALTYDELIEAHFLKAEPSPDNTGYDIKMRPAADAESYSIFATPLQGNATTHSFFMDQTGVVRAELGKDATASSPKFS